MRPRSIRKPLRHGDRVCAKLAKGECTWITVDSRMIRVTDGAVVGYRGTLETGAPGFHKGDHVVIRSNAISKVEPPHPLQIPEVTQEENLSPLAWIAGGLGLLLLLSR